MQWQKLFLFLMMSFLISCNQEVQTQESDISKKPTQYVKPHTTKSQVTKPHAAVSMDYDVMDNVELNQKLDINLRFKVGHNVDSLQVEYHIESGLSTVGVQNIFQFTSLSKGAVQAVVLSVLPEQSGKHIIHVYATISVNGVDQSRAFIVPVSIGSVSSAADSSGPASSNLNQPQAVQQKSLRNTSGGGMRYLPEQNVISMPASEPAN